MKKSSTSSVVSAQKKPSATSTVVESAKQLLQQASADTKQSYSALVTIRTRVLKQKNGINDLIDGGGPQIFLDVLERGKDKELDVCLSILGNCCMENAFRTEILQRDGASIIGTVLQETKSTSIQNRSCRTLANLALVPEGSQKLHGEDGLIEAIVRILAGSKDPGSQQTFIRIIRLLSDTKIHRLSILKERGLKVVADLLKSPDDGVATAALKAVSHYVTNHQTADSALQLDLAETSKFLFSCVSENKAHMAASSRSLILCMVKHECFRPGLGNAGSIGYFLEQLSETDAYPENKQDNYAYINALCLSCKESLNRVRIREQGGLEFLIGILEGDGYKQIHNRIISAFLCFLYDEASFQILLKNGLIKLLMKHLSHCLDDPKGPIMEKDFLFSQLQFGFNNVLEEIVDCDKLNGPSDLSVKDENALIPEMFDKEQGTRETQQKNETTVDQSMTNEDISICTDVEDDNATPLLLPGIPDVEDHPLEDDNTPEDVAKRRNVVKYSMDSPTYKEITESRSEFNYDPMGPTSLLDCQDCDGGSPGYSSPSGYRSPSWSPGSPLSVISSYSDTYSPMSTMTSFVSPDRSPRARLDDIPGNPGSPVPGSLSPMHGCVYNSPTKSPAYSTSYSPISSPQVCHDLQDDLANAVPQYSSEEECEDSQSPKKKTKEHENFKHEKGLQRQGSPGKNQVKCGLGLGTEEKPKLQSESPKDTGCLKTTDEDPVQAAIGFDAAALKNEISDQNPLQDVSSLELPSPEIHKNATSATEANILILLSRVSFMENSEKHLANGLVIEGILNYLINSVRPLEANWSRAHRVLLRIFKNPLALEDLLVIGTPSIFVLKCELSATSTSKTTPTDEIEDSHSECPPDELNSVTTPSDLLPDGLKALSLIAHSRFGHGVTRHALMTGTLMNRLRAFMAVPLLYSDPKDVKSMLSLVPKGYEFVTRSLTSDNDTVFGSAVIFLSHYAKLCLGHHKYKDWHGSWDFNEVSHPSRKRKRTISQEITDTGSPNSVHVPKSSRKGNDTELNLTFQLSNGSRVLASREKMSSSSSVFSAMLQGYFSESNQSTVQINDASSSAFSVLVEYLHAESAVLQEQCLKAASLDDLLGMLGLSERFLLPNLHHDVCIEIPTNTSQMRLGPLPGDCDAGHSSVTTLVKILQISLLHNAPYVAERAIIELLDIKFPLTFRQNVIRKCLFDDSGKVNTSLLAGMKNLITK